MVRQNPVNGADAPTEPARFQCHDLLEERGALGRYQGFEKAYRKMQSEPKKIKVSHATENVDEIAHFIPWEKPISELLFPSHPSETTDPRQSSPVMDNGTLYTHCLSPGYPTVQGEKPRIADAQAVRS
jgi:hypothetical protein